MNSVVDTILQRRSVRFYQKKEVPRNLVETVLNAGNHAPTGAGMLKCRYVVVQDASLREKLATLSVPLYEKWMKNAAPAFKAVREQIDEFVADPIYYSAPVVVFVIGSGMTADFDCSMVCENMMVAAQSLGLGSCWVYFGQLVASNPEIKAILKMQNGEKIYGPILLGYAQGSLPPREPKPAPVVEWI